jgi:cobalt-zinc-cadmium resistance protein CzcA
VKLAPGEYIEWGGQFQNLQAATQRLMIIVPLCFILIAAALYMAIGSVSLTATVLTAVPMALAGGVFAIALRGIPFSISASVGFIAVSGVAVLNGLVLISAIRKRMADGQDSDSAVIEGAMERVRPVLMTALVASLGFVPMAIATGTGAEVQKPLATVVVGGLLTATVLTLFVLPALCGWLLRREKPMCNGCRNPLGRRNAAPAMSLSPRHRGEVNSGKMGLVIYAAAGKPLQPSRPSTIFGIATKNHP